jgi:histidinol dehydrogenase
VKIIQAVEFDSFWKRGAAQNDDETELAVKEIIAAVRNEGDAALRRIASRFDKSSPEKLEVPISMALEAREETRRNDPQLYSAIELSALHIKRFCQKQREQFFDFEYEMEKGLVTGQRVIPAQRAAIYVPGGRFPLFSSVMMCLLPAFCAGVEEVFLASPPLEDGIPDRKILAAAAITAEIVEKKLRVFAIGGAQAIAALALGTESIPSVDVVAGPGNKYVAAAKRLLFGEVGIDFIAGPSDVLIVSDNSATADISRKANSQNTNLIAADMIAQAEHDPDARARALVPNREFAEKIVDAIEKQLAMLPTAETARSSLESGGLIIVYGEKEEAIRIANTIAPEHLELHVTDPESWIPKLKNYGSLFLGALSAEVLGDYSAGINHTLPTSGSACFTGGLSVRHFLKTVTTLRCSSGDGFEKTRQAAEILSNAEGLAGHAQSAALRKA